MAESALVVPDIGPETNAKNPFAEWSVEEHLRRLFLFARQAWSRGDRGFLARQAEFSLLAWRECRCPEHSCGGCRASMEIGNTCEQAIGTPAAMRSLPLEEQDRERDMARAAWNKQANKFASRLAEVQARFDALKGFDRREAARAAVAGHEGQGRPSGQGSFADE